MLAIELFKATEDFCLAIYKGGSSVDPVITTKHDIDYIWFVKPFKKYHLLHKLMKLKVLLRKVKRR